MLRTTVQHFELFVHQCNVHCFGSVFLCWGGVGYYLPHYNTHYLTAAQQNRFFIKHNVRPYTYSSAYSPAYLTRMSANTPPRPTLTTQKPSENAPPSPPPLIRPFAQHVLADTSAVGVVGCGIVGEQLAREFVQVYDHVLVFDTNEAAMARVITHIVGPAGRVVEAATSLEVVARACHTLCLALPTPASVGGPPGHNLKAIHLTLSFLHAYQFQGPILIRSTLCPGTTDGLAQTYPGLILFHVPEFLSSRTAHLDAALPMQPLVLLGVPDRTPAALVDRVRTTLEMVARGRQRVMAVRARESEATKVLCNAFYAAKVQLFNEFYNIVHHEDIAYDTVRQLMLQQGWIHPMHTQVPGADGQLGVGGACLPKDTRALTQWADAAGIACPLLRALCAGPPK